MTSSHLPPSGEDGPSFDALLADVMKNPERVLSEDLSSEQILGLQKQLNPYAYVAGDAGDGEHKRAVAASYTNLRADYLQRFTMTSLVGFLFRMFDEWVVPAEARRWVSKAAAKRENAAAAEAAAEPFTPDELVERAEALTELAKLAQAATAEGDEAKKAALAADAELAALDAGEEAADGDARASAAAKAKEFCLVADKALAKARGLHYATTHAMRKLGMECDSRIDALTAIARQHPEVREVIDKDPIVRPKPGQREMPPDAAKQVIGNFLRAMFEYNPDAHVRSAYDEFVVTRATKETEVPGLDKGAPTDTADPARLPLAVLRSAAPTPATEADRQTVAALTTSAEAYNAAVYMLRNETAAAALTTALAAPERFARYLFPIAPGAPARAAVDIIPSQDTFHRWRYYTEVNYEELRTATDAIYHEKPDLDWALILYDYFEGTPGEVDVAFEKFRDKHQEEVISDIRGVDFGGWTLLGDFKENRAKINFYNKHTDILKRILDRHAEDKKLGQELMRNRVRQLKAKNIREEGPDAPGLAEYHSETAARNVGGAGAERVISREEMTRLERARGDIRAAKELEVLDQCKATIQELTAAAKLRELAPEEERRLKDAQADLVRAQEMVEVPRDAIQVDVWSHDTASGKLEKSKFYTAAEAPEYLKDGPAGTTGATSSSGPVNSSSAGPASSSSTTPGAATASSSSSSAAGPPAGLVTNQPLAPYAQALLDSQLAAERAQAEKEMAERVGIP